MIKLWEDVTTLKDSIRLKELKILVSVSGKLDIWNFSKKENPYPIGGSFCNLKFITCLTLNFSSYLHKHLKVESDHL